MEKKLCCILGPGLVCAFYHVGAPIQLEDKCRACTKGDFVREGRGVWWPVRPGRVADTIPEYKQHPMCMECYNGPE